MESKKHISLFIACIVIITFSVLMAHFIERDFGKVDVQTINLVDSSGYTIAGKLLRPVSATQANKMPGILSLHGYQNDKDVQDGFNIELARRGFVVLAVDGLGHGDSEGMFDFGSFFIDQTYTMGTETGFLYLETLPFVDTDKLGITGHSMGGNDSFKIAALHPEIKALVSQDGGVGTIDNQNVLVIIPKMADMGGSLENRVTIDPAAFGLTAPVEWGKTYGNFSDGSAREAVLVNGNHHLVTTQTKSVSAAVNWFEQALKCGEQDALYVDPSNQIFLWKEFFTLLALLFTIISLIPLTNLLLVTEYFKPVAQPVPNQNILSNRSWWLFATINALIGGLIYLFVTSPNYGASILGAIPFMRLQNMGNGLAIWFLVNALICAILFYVWYRNSAEKTGITMYDMGVSFDKKKTKLDWNILGKTLLLGVILFAWMYVLEGISQWALGEEFRFMWPFMRQFSTPFRFGEFLIYLIPTLFFFLINGGIALFGQLRLKEYGSGTKTQWIWWLKVLYASLLGLFLVWAIQYLPWMLFGTGPGFVQTLDASWAIWPLMLFVYLPEFVVLLFMLTWFYRRTGRIYLGALIVSILATWFLVAGTVIGL